MTRDFRHDTESEPNMRTSSPVSELVDLRECIDRFVEAFPAAASYPLIKRGYAALTTLTTLSTRNAELEREVKRLRDLLQEIEDSADLTAAMSGHLYDRLIDALSASPQGAEHE